jgi:hypothetical protein
LSSSPKKTKFSNLWQPVAIDRDRKVPTALLHTAVSSVGKGTLCASHYPHPKGVACGEVYSGKGTGEIILFVPIHA